MTMEEQFKKWWASQDTEGLSISAKYAAWNGWRAAALQASAPEEGAPLPIEVDAAHALKDFLLARESDIAWSIEDFGGLLPVFKAVTHREPSPTMNNGG